MIKSEYAKAKQYAQASKTETLNYFIKNADVNIGNNAELKEIAIIELEKRKNKEYCKYYNIK